MCPPFFFCYYIRMKYLHLTITLITSTTLAGTITVPKEMQTIGDAINAAQDGDRILVSSGTYNETINLRGKALIIESVSGRSSTIINAQNLGSCILGITDETNDTIVRGFTLTGGIGHDHEGGKYGGGIFLYGSSPTIEDCAIIDNHADWGGGLHNLGSNPILTNCLFESNTAIYNGGGMRSHEYSSPTIFNCVFNDNIAQFGGALDFALDSIPTIDQCEIIGNGANIQGGAIYVGCDCSSPNITNSTICWNVPQHIVGGWNDNGGNELCIECEADVTRDGIVDVSDVLDIINAWGPGACIQDITGEGGVDVNDLLIVVGSWGACE